MKVLLCSSYNNVHHQPLTLQASGYHQIWKQWS